MPCTVGADSISARGSMRQRKPRGGVKTAWRRTTSAASQQSWPAHAVVCPAGANIVRSPVSLRSTVVPRLQPRTSLRFAVHGCHVGSGLDRSGHSPRSSPFPGAACRGRIYAARSCTVGADSISARGSMRQRKPLRRGQDPSLRFAVHGCHVGSGLDRSGHSPRSSPFPGAACRGRIYAARSCTVGADSISARGSMRQRKPLRRGQDPSLRFAVHGCHVGSGLDRSGHSPRSSPFPGAAHARPLPTQGTEQK